MKITILALVNFIFFQWFFIRLAKVSDADTGKFLGWKLLKWPVPLTGWWSNYIFM